MWFGDTPASSFTVVSPTQIEAVTPGGAPGAGAISVENPRGTGSGSAFSYDCSGFDFQPGNDFISDFAGAMITLDLTPHTPPPGASFVEYYWDCQVLLDGFEACDQIIANTDASVNFQITSNMQIRVGAYVRIQPGNNWCGGPEKAISALEAVP